MKDQKSLILLINLRNVSLNNVSLEKKGEEESCTQSYSSDFIGLHSLTYLHSRWPQLRTFHFQIRVVEMRLQLGRLSKAKVIYRMESSQVGSASHT